MAIGRLSYDSILSGFSRTLTKLDQFIDQQRADRDQAEAAEFRAAEARQAADDNINKAQATRTKIADLIGVPNP